MKKFARCVLILIFVIIVSGACGYFYEDKTLTTMYTSTTQLYVVPGEAKNCRNIRRYCIISYGVFTGKQ